MRQDNWATAPHGATIVATPVGAINMAALSMTPEADDELAVTVPALSRLGVRDFRCYQAADLTLDANLIVLTGANGAGKTNLLEAISLLAPGRGLRRAKLAEIERVEEGASRSGNGWAVSARIETGIGPVDIGTGRVPDAPERRVVKIDGVVQRSQTALAPLLAVAWLTPQMDRIFIEGASGRRRFLDRLVYGVDADHAARLTAYDHAMRERARLLRDGRFERAWLEALEMEMATRAIAIAAARIAFVERLGTVAEADLAPFPVPDLSLSGEVETALATEQATQVDASLRERLATLRRVDAESGMTTAGTHRSDFVVTHRVKRRQAADCSTGEQKALLIAIQLAHARLVADARGEPPLLLLDEIAAHLDRGRLEALFAALTQLGGQVWLSGTEREQFSGLNGRAQFFHVAHGNVMDQ